MVQRSVHKCSIWMLTLWHYHLFHEITHIHFLYGRIFVVCWQIWLQQVMLNKLHERQQSLFENFSNYSFIDGFLNSLFVHSALIFVFFCIGRCRCRSSVQQWSSLLWLYPFFRISSVKIMNVILCVCLFVFSLVMLTCRHLTEKEGR